MSDHGTDDDETDDDVFSDGVTTLGHADGTARSEGGSDGVPTDPDPTVMLAPHEYGKHRPYPYQLTAAQAADGLLQTRRFVEWLCSWDDDIAWNLPVCWDEHPMVYRMMEALRVSHAGTTSGCAREAAWMLNVLLPMGERLAAWVSNYGLLKPHSHDPAATMTGREPARIAHYHDYGDPSFPEHGDWNWPARGGDA